MPCGSPTGTTTAARVTAVAENPPLLRYRTALPRRDLFQIACRVYREPSDSAVGESLVFLVALLSVLRSTLYEVLREILVAPLVLKLGFRFKQDPSISPPHSPPRAATPAAIDD
ncbi:uncharacterized protein [Elaeis guineensis]|uniref:uncharacterized protein n=1 Tax=Elaeis guineensis var. tenera TaxID=51953 RepID=UPI003C6D6918